MKTQEIISNKTKFKNNLNWLMNNFDNIGKFISKEYFYIFNITIINIVEI